MCTVPIGQRRGQTCITPAARARSNNQPGVERSAYLQPPGTCDDFFEESGLWRFANRTLENRANSYKENSALLGHGAADFTRSVQLGLKCQGNIQIRALSSSNVSQRAAGWVLQNHTKMTPTPSSTSHPPLTQRPTANGRHTTIPLKTHNHPVSPSMNGKSFGWESSGFSGPLTRSTRRIGRAKIGSK